MSTSYAQLLGHTQSNAKPYYNSPLDTLAFHGLNAEQRQLAESVTLAQRVNQCFEDTANAMKDSRLQARDVLHKGHKQNVMERERAAGREVRARTSSKNNHS